MSEELETFTDIMLDYIRYCYNPKRKYSPVWSNNFEQESYQKWAINESIKYVFEHPNQSPLTSLLSFLDKLDTYSCMDKGFVFSSAKDIVEDIIFRLYGTFEHPRKDFISKGKKI